LFNLESGRRSYEFRRCEAQVTGTGFYPCKSTRTKRIRIRTHNQESAKITVCEIKVFSANFGANLVEEVTWKVGSTANALASVLAYPLSLKTAGKTTFATNGEQENQWICFYSPPQEDGTPGFSGRLVTLGSNEENFEWGQGF